MDGGKNICWGGGRLGGGGVESYGKYRGNTDVNVMKRD